MLRFLSLLFFSSLGLAQELPPGAFARLGGTALRHPERPLAFAFRAGTTELASLGSDGTVRIWDTTTGKELHVLRKKDSQANGMAVSANGAFLAVHFGESQLRIYDAAKKYELSNNASVKMLEGMTITNDGKLVGGMHLAKPMIFETANGLERMELPDGTAVAVAPDGKSVAVALKDFEYVVEVYEVPSGKKILRMLRPGTPKANITSIAYAPDSRTLAMASDTDAPPTVLFTLGKEELIAKIDGSGPVAFANADSLCVRTRIGTPEAKTLLK